MEVLDRSYSWEEINDIDRDVYEAIEDATSGEFKGLIHIVITLEQVTE